MNRQTTLSRVTLRMLLLLALCTSLTAGAYDFTYNNVYFNITSTTNRTCEVTQRPSKYSAQWIIPANPIYNGVMYTCTAIGDSAFKDCTGMTSCTLPSTITKIGAYAFSGCKILPQLIIPEGVTSIGNYAFMNCDHFTSVTIPNAVTWMGQGAFYGCDSLKTATWSTGMTNIPYYTFYSCYELSDFALPHWITSIDYCALAYTGLTQAIIPYGVKTVASNALCGCSKLHTVLIPSSVTSLGYNALNYCDNLETVYCNMATPPANMVFTCAPGSCRMYCPVGSVRQYNNASGWDRFTVKAGAYDYNYGASGYNASSIYHMTITSNQPVTYGNMTFAGTAKYVYHPNIETTTATSYSPSLYEEDDMCHSGKRYLITEIGDSAFYSSSASIKQFNFKPCSALTKVGHDAFWVSQAEVLTLPSGVTNYGEYSIYYMPNLTDLHVMNTTPATVPSNTFYQPDQQRATLHVPTQAAVTDYSAADYWKKFYSITTTEELVWYDVWVGGVQVTNANMHNITSPNIVGGKVTYDPSSNTLTLENATITGGESEYAISFNVIDANRPNTVRIVGTGNRIGTADAQPMYGIVSAGRLNVTGNGYGNSKLTATTAMACLVFGDELGGAITNVALDLTSQQYCPIQGPSTDMYTTWGTLTVTSSRVAMNPAGTNRYYPISYMHNLTLTDCYIAQPLGGKWSTGVSGIVDQYGEVVVDQPAVIEPGTYYGVDICGIPVTNANCNNITGPGISGSVQYIPEGNLVALNGATLLSDDVAINFHNGMDARVFFTGHDNSIGLEDNPVDLGICADGPNLSIEGASYTRKDHSLNIYSETTPVMHQSVDTTSVSFTTLADGNFHFEGSVVMWGGMGIDPTVVFRNIYAELVPEGLYYPFQWYEYMTLNDCYISEPEGGYWRSIDETPEDYLFGWVCNANGRAHAGTIVISPGEAPVIVTRGDVNGDGNIAPADISALIDYLLNGSQINMANADCDLNGSVDPADISSLIDYLLNDTWSSALMAPAADKALSILEMPARHSAAAPVDSKPVDLSQLFKAPQQQTAPQAQRRPSVANEAPLKPVPAGEAKADSRIIDDKAI